MHKNNKLNSLTWLSLQNNVTFVHQQVITSKQKLCGGAFMRQSLNTWIYFTSTCILGPILLNPELKRPLLWSQNLKRTTEERPERTKRYTSINTRYDMRTGQTKKSITKPLVKIQSQISLTNFDNFQCQLVL